MTRIWFGLLVLVVACANPNGGGLFPDAVCEGQTCSGHGTCVASGDLPTCSCDAGYHPEGLTCVEDGTTGPCNGVTCSGHGVCTDAGGETACLCETGYHAEQLSCVKDGTSGPCANVDCGNGLCVDTGGSAACQCDAGYHPDGLTCKPDCTAWPGTLDVPRVYVSGTVTLDGGAFAYGAVLRFVETTSNDSFTIYTDADGVIDQTPVAPGTYRVYYSKRSGGGWATEPWNEQRPLGTVVLTTTTQIALDVPRVYLSGAVTLAGGAFAYGAVLHFDEALTDDSITVYLDADGQIDPTPVSPGSYRVLYSKRSGGGWATEPWNDARPLGCYVIP